MLWLLLVYPILYKEEGGFFVHPPVAICRNFIKSKQLFFYKILVSSSRIYLKSLLKALDGILKILLL